MLHSGTIIVFNCTISGNHATCEPSLRCHKMANQPYRCSTLLASALDSLAGAGLGLQWAMGAAPGPVLTIS